MIADLKSLSVEAFPTIRLAFVQLPVTFVTIAQTCDLFVKNQSFNERMVFKVRSQ
jgi:hypothetical protein